MSVKAWRHLATSLAVFIAGCSSPHTEPDVPDAADSPDSPDSPEPYSYPPSLAARLVPGDRFDSGCAPWAPVPEIPRGLPADSTPRVLWRWDPTTIEDVFRPGTGPVAVSPDGTVFTFVGNEVDILVALSRSGELLWEEPLATGGVYMPVALPDGRVAAFRRSDNAIVVFGASGLSRVFPPSRASSGGCGRMAVGPAGRLYALWSDGLSALCQDGGTAWTLLFEQLSCVSMHIEGDGAVVLDTVFERGPVRISSSGEVSGSEAPVEVPPGWASDAFRIDDTTMWGVAPFAGSDRTVLYFLQSGPSPAWPVPDAPLAFVGPGGFLDALGGAWFWTGDGESTPRRLRRYSAPDALTFDHGTELGFPQSMELAEDGSLIASGGDVRRLMPDDGLAAWTVTFAERLGTQSTALTNDGVLYLGTTDAVYAVQTDALPTTVDHCATGLGCNGRRDGAVRLFH